MTRKKISDKTGPKKTKTSKLKASKKSGGYGGYRNSSGQYIYYNNPIERGI